MASRLTCDLVGTDWWWLLRSLLLNLHLNLLAWVILLRSESWRGCIQGIETSLCVICWLVVKKLLLLWIVLLNLLDVVKLNMSLLANGLISFPYGFLRLLLLLYPELLCVRTDIIAASNILSWSLISRFLFEIWGFRSELDPNLLRLT